jgi:hypothetical protein
LLREGELNNKGIGGEGSLHGELDNEFTTEEES